MSRQWFGSWGAELGDGEFAKALAALGVLGADGIPFSGQAAEELLDGLDRGDVLWWAHWILPLYPFGTPPLAASQLAEMWNGFLKRTNRPIRLRAAFFVPETESERGADPFDTGWALTQLLREEVGVGQVVVVTQNRGQEDDWSWEWPLNLAVLGAPYDARAESLRSEIEATRKRESGFVERLLRTEATADDCDILLAPGTLDETARLLLASRATVRATVVIVTGGTDDPANALPLLAAVRGRTGAALAAVLPPMPMAYSTWLKEFVRELSHNRLLDEALFPYVIGGSSQVIGLGSLRFLRYGRVHVTMGRLLERMRLANPDETVKLTDHLRGVFGFPDSTTTIGKLRDALRRYLPDAPFNYERESATTTADVANLLQNLQGDAVPRKTSPDSDAGVEPRYITADVTRSDRLVPGVRYGEGPFATKATAFRAGETYDVRIRVARGDTKSMQQASEPFPVDRLPPGEEGHRLTVVMTEPRLLKQPLVGTVDLPPSGDSTPIYFQLPVPAGLKARSPKRVEARIMVLFRNRLLQTAILSGPVVSGRASSVNGDEIGLKIESVVRPAADLAGRRRFDGMLLMNHITADRIPTLTYLSGNRHAFKVGDMDAACKLFDRHISRVANNPSAYDGDLASPQTVGLLRTLAKHGSVLYKQFADFIDGDELSRAERIQVVSMTPEARLPVEFVYDRPAPSGKAELCAGARQALATGRCPHCEGKGSKSVICPMGFWGLRKVIERHQFVAGPTPLADGEFALRAEGIEARVALDPLNGAIFGASDRASIKQPDGLEHVRRTLCAASGCDVQRITDWEQWVHHVGARANGLHVLITHSGLNEDEMQFIEIGAGHQLELSAIDKEHVNLPTDRPRPIVLLIGCETARQSHGYERLVSQFRRAGAAIVVASGSVVLGRHATQVVASLVECLDELEAGESSTLGEIMRRMRCRMLVRGIPMALCLSCYGDADWRLVRRASASTRVIAEIEG